MTDLVLRDNLVNLTCDLMKIQSDELHSENRKRCLEVARSVLAPMPGIQLTDFEDEGHPSLVALPQGVAEPEVLMVTHLDVVTHEAGDFPEPRIENNRIVGPGAGDMKGLVAICLNVFADCHRARPGIPLGLAITTDEETGGHHGAKALVEKTGLRADAVLVPDGGGPDMLSVAEKGILHLSLRATGQETHAASPWHGINAVENLVSTCLAIKQRIEALECGYEEWMPTCSITGIHTPNQSVNIIPAHAEAMLDIRFPPPHRGEEVMAMIKGLLSNGVELAGYICDDASKLNPESDYEACMKQVMGAVYHVRNEGGSDARFFSRLGIPVNMSRPLVGNIHADDEWIDIDSMLKFYDLYVRYITKRCSPQ